VQEAQKIACYLPLKTEVDTWPFVSRALAQNKFVFVPVVQKKYSMVFRKISADSEFRTSELGISEPLTAEEIDARELDLVVMPLVAFDSARNRIGMGGGYYDRAFEFAGKDDNTSIPSLIGVAFDCQCVEKISPNPWDIKLSKIITESRAY
jgi:5-formyltetrahydrofolate cyclo-ligase